MKFYLVDTFSSAAITRQPSCVILIDNNQEMPSLAEMTQNVAELGYSDIVFLKQVNHKNMVSKYFSHGEIIPFNVNSTIAAYTVLYNEGLIEDNGLWTEDTGFTILTIQINDGLVTVSTESAEKLTEDLNCSNETNLYNTIGVQLEKISKKPTANYFRTSLPGVMSKMLPEIKTPVMNLKTLMSLFQEISLPEEVNDTIAGTPLESLMANNAFDPITSFMTEAFNNSDSFKQSMTKKDNEHINQVMAIASPILPTAESNILEHLNLAKDKSSDSYGRIMKHKENDAIQFCGCGTVMAEGQFFI